jgi:hypothetical protein
MQRASSEQPVRIRRAGGGSGYAPRGCRLRRYINDLVAQPRHGTLCGTHACTATRLSCALPPLSPLLPPPAPHPNTGLQRWTTRSTPRRRPMTLAKCQLRGDGENPGSAGGLVSALPHSQILRRASQGGSLRPAAVGSAGGGRVASGGGPGRLPPHTHIQAQSLVWATMLRRRRRAGVQVAGPPL